MSSVTTSKIDTANGSTNLTITTGNTNGPALIVTTTNDVYIRANTSANLFTVNTSSVRVNTSLTVTNTITVSTNTFNLGSPLLNSNGYSRLPNGLLMQWGSVSTNTSVGNIIFPAAYSNLYSFTYSLNMDAAYGGSTYMPLLIAVTTTTANIRTGNTTSKTAYWQAIGV
jgi:hypothetical protein